MRLTEFLKQNKFRFIRAKVIDNKDPLKLGRVKVWIPDIMFDIDDGIWALPANSYSGSNVDQKEKNQYSGSSYVPRTDDWVFVFFEDGNPNQCFYLFGIQLLNQPRIPETQSGSQWWNKWIIWRSPDGRAIWISDDSETPDSGVYITGKKQNLKQLINVENNQNLIAIQESDVDRILLATHKASYISINNDKEQIFIFGSSKDKQNKIHIFNDKNMIQLDNQSDGTVIVQNSKCKVKITGSNIQIDAPQNIKMQTNGASIEINNGTITIYATQSIILQAPIIQENPGISATPSPESPDSLPTENLP